ncbi:hypothetical protein OOK58_05925 [Streptomyces sp. NBC_01728]|uniref:hypothetical protein n=1 Tax=unclassified Streptomyces TaxID=2593676 RepID=UPI002257E4AB|nr:MULTISPECIES: hypothetical protein [unclassified Streptomyces]MCX4462121.1 hypothetical protein [Streptomyces sp. NBC_01719]MCX4491029.1 hypothetical protein [Streptomyces sp. NBC_01728]
MPDNGTCERLISVSRTLCVPVVSGLFRRGAVREPHPAGREKILRPVGCGYSMTWHRPALSRGSLGRVLAGRRQGRENVDGLADDVLAGGGDPMSNPAAS